jgi:helicase
LLAEKVRALMAMAAHGVDEQTVTLTLIEGIGGTLARRLLDVGITDIEDLALAETETVAGIRGVSVKRAERWIAAAVEKVRTHSAFTFRETRALGERTVAMGWSSHVDPYRLRRALDLNVKRHTEGFMVSGGLEPHRVIHRSGALCCDCADFGNGNVCKHVLATRLYTKDLELMHLTRRLASSAVDSNLDLYALWLEGGMQ